MIIPTGPANRSFNKNLDFNYLFNQFSDGLLIRVTTGFQDKVKESEWYSVICDDFKSIDEVNPKLRYQIKKGLKNCIVKPISTKFLAENGYDVYINAFKSYRNSKMPNISKKKFYENLMLGIEFEDILEYWGVFINEKLVAYSMNKIYDNEEVEYSVIKIDPAYLNRYPSDALIYTMNEYYLKKKSFKYVNDGFRSISHDTNIQDFLITKFNFKKQEVGLVIKYKWYLAVVIKITFIFRNIFRKIDTRIGAIYKLDEIRRIKEKEF